MYGLMIRSIGSIGWIRYDTFLFTIRSDGDYTPWGIPMGLGPLLYALGWPLMPSNVSDTYDLTAVRYYLANLGATMESQVTSSVLSPRICRTPLILSILLQSIL